MISPNTYSMFFFILDNGFGCFILIWTFKINIFFSPLLQKENELLNRFNQKMNILMPLKI